MSDAPIVDVQDIVENSQLGTQEMNLRITAGYHRLSEAIRDELPAGPNADWCGFAKWSSATVGKHFDPHAVPGRFELFADSVTDHLPFEFAGTLRPIVIRLLKHAEKVENGLVLDALRLGNAVIFAEMASVFSRLVARLGERRRPNSQTDEEFAAEVVAQALTAAAGITYPPSLTPVQLGSPSQEHLVNGIQFYLRAAREPEHQPQLMLAGNLSFSIYEQTRADRVIAIGTSAPIRAVMIRVPFAKGSMSAADVLLAGYGQSPPLINRVETFALRRFTSTAMIVEVDGERVRLGLKNKLPGPTFGITLPEVERVIAAVSASARDRPTNWVDLAYRLGFIARYFAAYQQNPKVLNRPSDPPRQPGAVRLERRAPLQ